MDNQDELWMARCLELARQAADQNEVPVGAVLVRDDQVLGEGFNQTISSADPSAHAEIVALRAASKAVGNYRLPGSTLYVSVEPCTMCTGALIHARVSRLVFGAQEPRAGAVVSQMRLLEQNFYNHSLSYTGGVLEQESSALITDFFRQRRS